MSLKESISQMSWKKRACSAFGVIMSGITPNAARRYGRSASSICAPFMGKLEQGGIKMNSEHYSDPTAEMAIGEAEKKRKIELRRERRYKVRQKLLKRSLEMLAESFGFHIRVTFIKK